MKFTSKDIRDRIFGVISLVGPSLRFEPDHPMDLEDILIQLRRIYCMADYSWHPDPRKGALQDRSRNPIRVVVNSDNQD